MIFRRRKAERPPYAIPDGQRIYAIGDIHGCATLLDSLLDIIASDDAARGPADTLLIFLGDLVDRGPESARVVERVRQLCADPTTARLVKGNHDDVFVRAANGSARAARSLIGIGGGTTLLSYGIDQEEIDHGTFDDLAALLQRRIPRDHVNFLAGASDRFRIGDFAFVHAGVRPGVALDEQQAADLFWIREPFLDSKADHGAMIVHGHSVTAAVELRTNRIGVDTGAYATGTLSAIGIEGSACWILDTATPDASE